MADSDLPIALTQETYDAMMASIGRVNALPPRRDSQSIYRAAPEGNAHNWIKVTSVTGSTVTLGGGTVTGYPAVWGLFDSGGTGWTFTSNSSWFVPPPGSRAPALNEVFQCRLLGADTSGKPIWGAGAPVALTVSAALSSVTAIPTPGTAVQGPFVSVALGPAGTYWVSGQATAQLEVSSVSGSLPANFSVFCSLSNIGSSTDTPYAMVCSSLVANVVHNNTAYTQGPVTVGANATIYLFIGWTTASNVTLAQLLVAGGAQGNTGITAVLLG